MEQAVKQKREHDFLSSQIGGFVRVNFAAPQKVDIAVHGESAYFSGTHE